MATPAKAQSVPARSIAGPPVALTPPAVPVPPPPQTKPRGAKPAPPMPGKGGEVHKRWQRQVCLVAEQRGWTSQIEGRLGAFGDTDVLLRKGKFEVACEIARTSPEKFEVQSIGKRLAAGMSFVVVMGEDSAHVDKIKELATVEFGSQVGTRIHFLTMDELGTWLDMVDASTRSGEEVIGEAKVKVEFKPTGEAEKRHREGLVQRALKSLFRKMRGTGKPPGAVEQ